MRCRLNFRMYVLLLCGVYFTMLYIFHGNLQLETRKRCFGRLCNRNEIEDEVHSPRKLKRKVLETGQELNTIIENTTTTRAFVDNLLTLSHPRDINYSSVEKTSSFKRDNDIPFRKICFLPADNPNRTFLGLEPTFYVYSAYLDERYGTKMIRIMAILSLNKVNRHLNVFCNFRDEHGSLIQQPATFYELCENHGKTFGGFILSCPIPRTVVDLCFVNVSLQIIPVHHQYSIPDTQPVLLPFTLLSPETSPKMSFAKELLNVAKNSSFKTENISKPFYNFTVCVPPLFGKLSTIRFVEFVELNRILGFQHFIFYIGALKNTDIFTVLEYYKNLGIATTINWMLPSNIRNNQIWYNGQLSVHNDCMYRAMSMTEYLALIDIDEHIVPHNGKTLESLAQMFDENVCGLKFDSAFYDPKYSDGSSSSKLLTLKNTGRSSLFSKVRSKVLLKPSKVFEVGIHHISKQAQENFTVVRVNTSIAYLHHYRACMPNYGMKCGTYVKDKTLDKFAGELEQRVKDVLNIALGKSI